MVGEKQIVTLMYKGHPIKWHPYARSWDVRSFESEDAKLACEFVRDNGSVEAGRAALQKFLDNRPHMPQDERDEWTGTMAEFQHISDVQVSTPSKDEYEMYFGYGSD